MELNGVQDYVFMIDILDNATQFVLVGEAVIVIITKSGTLCYCGNIGSNWKACTNCSVINCESATYMFDDEGTMSG